MAERSPVVVALQVAKVCAAVSAPDFCGMTQPPSQCGATLGFPWYDGIGAIAHLSFICAKAAMSQVAPGTME